MITTSPNIMPDTWRATSGHLAALPSPPEHTGTMVNGGVVESLRETTAQVTRQRGTQNLNGAETWQSPQLDA